MRSLVRFVPIKSFFIAAVSLLASVTQSRDATAQAYLETGQTGAQTQIDVNHSTTIYIGAVAPFSLGGAKYVMKRGSSSSYPGITPSRPVFIVPS